MMAVLLWNLKNVILVFLPSSTVDMLTNVIGVLRVLFFNFLQYVEDCSAFGILTFCLGAALIYRAQLLIEHSLLKGQSLQFWKGTNFYFDNFPQCIFFFFGFSSLMGAFFGFFFFLSLCSTV